MKQTRQKALILNALENRNDHPTAEVIYQELLEIDPRISLATVYRNLNTFAENGKIRRIELPNMKDRFDSNMKAHHHALCSECGKITDIPVVKTPRKKYVDIEGFKVHEVEVLYKGICPHCQSKSHS